MHLLKAASASITHALLALVLVVSAQSAQALDPLASLKLGEAEGKLLLLEQSLNDPEANQDLAVLKELQAQGHSIRDVANDCIKTNEASISADASALDLLGAKQDSESTEVTAKRDSLNKAMLGSAQQLASCRLLLLRSNEIVDKATKRQQQMLAHELLARKSELASNVTFVLLHPLESIDAFHDFVRNSAGIQRAWLDKAYLLGLLAVAVMLVLFSKRLLKSSLQRHINDDQTGYLNQFLVALLSCLDRHLPPLIFFAVFGAYYLYLGLSAQSWDFIGLSVMGLFLYVLANLVVRITLNPVSPGKPLTNLPLDISLLLARRLRLLSKMLLLGFLLYSALQIHDFPVQLTGLIRNVYIVLLILNLIWAVWLLRFYESIGNIMMLRAFIILGLLISLGADWMGYANLSNYILWGITGSMLIWLLTLFLLRIWSDFFDSLDEGRHAWQRTLRKRIGVAEEEFIPGSIWFRFTFTTMIWSLSAVIVLKVWGLPDTGLLKLRDGVVEGFQLGDVKIVPLKIVIALLSFAVMLSIIGWLKRGMDKSWLNRSRMDRGAKEATVSLTGYFAVAAASLIALSMAGLELSNLAIIAGALSVGIGFGLQNIVNNFISGVILLFERPIKTGDWISVGGTEGYVRKISIRSTQIQTFDRSDVIVPNSELISGQVVNMMLRDSIGRIIVPVGVAYGSDTEKVKQIMLDIAYQHSGIISQSPILSKPAVLFRSFGDSSLNFELRAFIKVVDDRLRIISDINFAIDKAFREEGIEIPFPQRVVHTVPSKAPPTDEPVIAPPEPDHE